MSSEQEIVILQADESATCGTIAVDIDGVEQSVLSEVSDRFAALLFMSLSEIEDFLVFRSIYYFKSKELNYS